MFTKEQLEVAALLRCPFCGSAETENGGIEQMYIGEADIEFHCHDCDADWVITYSLTVKEGC